jgi:hypothetical protein
MAHGQSTYTSDLTLQDPYFVGATTTYDGGGSEGMSSNAVFIPYAIGVDITTSTYSVTCAVNGASWATTVIATCDDSATDSYTYWHYGAGFTNEANTQGVTVDANTSNLNTWLTGNSGFTDDVPTTQVGASVFAWPNVGVLAAHDSSTDPLPPATIVASVLGVVEVGESVVASNYYTPPTSASPISVTYSGTSGTWNGGAPNSACAEITFTNSSVPVEVDIPDPGITLGTIVFDSTGSYTIAGPGSLTIDCPANGGHVMIAQGSHQISAVTYILSNTDFTVPTGSTLTMSALVTSQPSLTLDGGGTLVVNQLNATSLAINSGTVKIIPQPTSPDALNILNSLSIAGPSSSPLATLDIGNAEVQLNYSSGSSPLATVQALVTAGYNGGSWSGPGITSSNVAAHASNGDSPAVAVGYFDNGSGTVTIGYVLAGDANMDGTVGLADFNILSANYGESGKDWQQGDFNYDGTVGLQDFNILAANYGDTIGEQPEIGLAGQTIAEEFQPLLEFAATHDELPQVEAILAARGIDVNYTPVPETSSLVVAAGVGASLARRRTVRV